MTRSKDCFPRSWIVFALLVGAGCANEESPSPPTLDRSFAQESSESVVPGYTTPLCGGDLHSCEEGEQIAAIYSEWEGEYVASWVTYLLAYKAWKTSPLRGADVEPSYDLPRITIENTFRTSWTQDPPDPRNPHSAPYASPTSHAIEALTRDGNKFWITVEASGIVERSRISRQGRARAPAGQNPYGTDSDGRTVYWDSIALDSATLLLIDPATYPGSDVQVSFVTERANSTRVWDWYR